MPFIISQSYIKLYKILLGPQHRQLCYLHCRKHRKHCCLCLGPWSPSYSFDQWPWAFVFPYKTSSYTNICLILLQWVFETEIKMDGYIADVFMKVSWKSDLIWLRYCQFTSYFFLSLLELSWDTFSKIFWKFHNDWTWFSGDMAGLKNCVFSFVCLLYLFE